jgi:adenylate kinase family enzyme
MMPTTRRARHNRAVRRVAVVGSGGAGKSTFARELGRRVGLPVIHLDEHFWRTGWVETPHDEWCARQDELLSTEAWIVDGNHGGTLDVRLAKADTVIILSLSRFTCVWRALMRTVRNRGRAIQAEGCPQRIDRDFLKFLRWIWRYPVDSRPRVDDAIDRHGANLHVIELRSPHAVSDFLARAGTRAP